MYYSMHRPHKLFHIKANKELKEAYWSVLLRGLSIGMVGLFVPLYFLKELSLSLNTVLFFYVMLYVMFGAFSPLTAKISSKMGSKHTVLASVPIYLIYIAMLYSIKDYNWPLVLLAGISAFANSLFWVAFNTDFAHAGDNKHRGAQIGFRYFLTALFTLSGPFIGGAILVMFGFKTLFIIVSVLMFTSALPLFFSEDIHMTTKFSIKEMFDKNHFKDMITFVGMGMRDGAASIVWPIFIFLVVGSYFTLGWLITLSGIIGAFYLLFMAKITDKHDKKKLIKIGSLTHSVVWYMRPFVDTAMAVLGINLLAHFTMSTMDIPYNALVYNRASKTNIPEYMVFREMGLAAGKIITFLIVMLTGSIALSFVTAGFASYLIMLI